MPIVGALVAGFLLTQYFPDSRGSGIPQTKAAFFIHEGFIRLRTTVGKFVCSSISLASGIALGREGPAVQVGAGIASGLGQRLGLSARRVRDLVPVGTSAALAAAFNTPIAAVVFTLEEIMGNLHAPLLGSVVLSSATAWVVLRLLLGNEPLFHVPEYQLVHPLEFANFALLGLIGGLVSGGFVKLLLFLRRRFLAMPRRSEWIQPAAGGVLVGLMAWFVPEVLGVGYGHIGGALNGQMALTLMLLLVPLKILATATCYASGNAGGIFAPSLFIGAMTGGALGTAANYLLPDYTGSVGAYALVGMGAAFAGIVRAPLTSVIMIFEITHDYSIVVPVMISNLISFFISSRLQKQPIYEALARQEGIHLPPGGARPEAVLVAKQAMRPASDVLSADDTLGSVGPADQQRHAWPVVSETGLLGMVSAAQVQKAREEGQGHSKLAKILPERDPEETLAPETFPHVHPDHPLDVVLKRMAATGLNILPVVSRANLRQLQGVVSMDGVLEAYGLGKDPSRAAAAKEPQKRTPAVPMAGVVAVTLSVIVLVSLFAYLYGIQRREGALQEFQEANELAQQDRDQEAVEKYRNALSISHSAEHRLALGMQLVKVKRWNEARVYLDELLGENPNSSLANLGLARVAAGQGRIQEAATYYRRAIYGSWPDKTEQNRNQTRFELAQVLAESGAEKRASTELLALVQEVPEADLATRKRIGQLLLDYGSPRESGEVFRGVLRQDRRDAEAYAGLAEAKFADGDYLAARRAFRNALRRNPNNAAVRKRLELCQQVVAMDPNLRGLRSTVRYRRSRTLVERASGVLEQCLAGMAEQAAPDPIRALLNSARSLLDRRGRPRSYDDATESNILLAKQLWAARAQLCEASGAVDEPLARVLGRLEQR